MTHIWQGLRSGQWLTAARARGYSRILLGISAIAVAGWIALSDGLIDRNGKPLGTDFSNVYAAGALTWQGRPEQAYVPALQHAAEKAVFGGRTCRSTAGIIRRSSSLSQSSWPRFPMLGPCDLACGELRRRIWRQSARILPRPETLLTAAAFPAVFVNIGHGQNGFLTTALLGGALHAAGSAPLAIGPAVRLPRLQAAIRRPDSDRACWRAADGARSPPPWPPLWRCSH